MPAIAAANAHAYGQCRSTAKTTIRYAATMANSPCAKFTTLVARKISTKPSATSAYTEPIPRPVKKSWRTRSISSRRGFDVLVEDDRALLVLHDVVPVQAVAVLVEVVLALGALVLADGEDRCADRLR